MDFAQTDPSLTVGNEDCLLPQKDALYNTPKLSIITHILQALGIWKPLLPWHILEDCEAKRKASWGSGEPYTWNTFSCWGISQSLSSNFQHQWQKCLPNTLSQTHIGRRVLEQDRDKQKCSLPGNKLHFNLEMLICYSKCRESFMLLRKQQEPCVPQADFILEQPS